ncbi:hypothetical protein PHJA_002220200, partial [Phtheirospermum japonicum]
PVLSWALSGDLQFISTACGQKLDEISVSLSKILSVHGYGWWAASSTAKLGLGISTIRRGHAGELTFMPLKAFSVTSFFVSVAAPTAMVSLRSSGLQSVRYSCSYFVFGVKNSNSTV